MVGTAASVLHRAPDPLGWVAQVVPRVPRLAERLPPIELALCETLRWLSAPFSNPLFQRWRFSLRKRKG